MWWEEAGWEVHPYHIGKNKEVFGAEIFAIRRALKITNRRGGSGRRYTIFSDSASDIDRIRSDGLSPDQRLAMATHEVGVRITGRSNVFAVRWTPAPPGC